MAPVVVVRVVFVSSCTEVVFPSSRWSRSQLRFRNPESFGKCSRGNSVALKGEGREPVGSRSAGVAKVHRRIWMSKKRVRKGGSAIEKAN